MCVKRWVAATLGTGAVLALAVLGGVGAASAGSDGKPVRLSIEERIGANHNQVLL